MNLYRDLHASLLRFCSDFAYQFLDFRPTFVNFDAQADEGSLPKSDIVGPLALSFELDEHLLIGTVNIGYSTWDDMNLFRLVERVDMLVELLKPGGRIAVYDSTGEVTSSKGALVIQNGTRVMPVVPGETRPIQFIAIQFTSTNTFKDAAP